MNRMFHAMRDVVTQDFLLHTPQRRARRRDLRDDVDAIAIIFDHRMTIPPSLREYAGLDKELAVLGNGSVIEVWDADRWKAYEAEVEESFANQSQEVFPGRF